MGKERNEMGKEKREMGKLFKVTDDRGYDLLGRQVQYENVYICLYPITIGKKTPEELEVGEKTRVIFRIGIYREQEAYIERMS